MAGTPIHVQGYMLALHQRPFECPPELCRSPEGGSPHRWDCLPGRAGLAASCLSTCLYLADQDRAWALRLGAVAGVSPSRQEGIESRQLPPGLAPPGEHPGPDAQDGRGERTGKGDAAE